MTTVININIYKYIAVTFDLSKRKPMLEAANAQPIHLYEAE